MNWICSATTSTFFFLVYLEIQSYLSGYPKKNPLKLLIVEKVAPGIHLSILLLYKLVLFSFDALVFT